ncbi:hypothetical protein ABUW04_04100 [Streptacidiphilus sp. N1-10]|uniref:Gram-positive cocci surface proteins LPxTG domain-containing protein n=2 Tax=Streptacidiphilus jeojiensis TaxID=3229225 RepID=A0ABV6XHL1_9ACTN
MAADTARVPSAGSGDYPLHTGSLEAESGTDGLRPGSPVSFSGGGFAPGAEVKLSVRSNEIALGTVAADASGSIETTVTLPGGLADGWHTLYAVGADAQGGTLVETLQIRVGRGGRLLARTGADSVPAAATGSDTPELAATGLGVAVLAGAAVLGGRTLRRKNG